MKLFFLTIATMFVSSIIYGQESYKTVNSEISDVTVFLSGGQIYREATVTLEAGSNYIKFEGLSSGLNKNSIQVGSNKEVTIVSVNAANGYLTNKKLSPKIKQLNDSLIDMQFNLDLRRKYKSVYENERAMLLSNKSIGGQQSGVNIEDLMEMANFFRTRMKDIELKLLDVAEEEKTINSTIQKLRSKLQSNNALAKRYVSEMTVNISSKVKTTAKIYLSYFVNNAYWIPSYDIRSKESDGPISLTYKGNVYQSTGSDWENVNVTLSTGNPTVNNTKPNVYPWVLNFAYTTLGYGNTTRNDAYKSKRATANGAYAVEDAAEVPAPMLEQELTANVVGGVTNQTTVNTEFKIGIPYTIKSNGQANVIDIKEHKLTAQYDYYTAPKFDKDAFLLAKITGWSDLNLMSGDATTYYQGTYIGKSYVNASLTKDTMDLSLGRDKSIVVTRKKIKEFCKSNVIGGNKKTSLGMEITVRNGKKIPISILVEDQIPISKVKEIEVTMIENSGAIYKEDTGSLKWNLDLQPGETKTLQLKYQVKYPKDKTISNL